MKRWQAKAPYMIMMVYRMHSVGGHTWYSLPIFAPDRQFKYILYQYWKLEYLAGSNIVNAKISSLESSGHW